MKKLLVQMKKLLLALTLILSACMTANAQGRPPFISWGSWMTQNYALPPLDGRDVVPDFAQWFSPPSQTPWLLSAADCSNYAPPNNVIYGGFYGRITCADFPDQGWYPTPASVAPDGVLDWRMGTWYTASEVTYAFDPEWRIIQGSVAREINNYYWIQGNLHTHLDCEIAYPGFYVDSEYTNNYCTELG